MTQRPLRLGLLGGGPGSFIGAVHRMAAGLDGRFTLVAGAFSRSLDKSRAQAERWGVATDRAYDGIEAMLASEQARENGIEAIAIATPNDSHFAIAKAALEAGLPVICDKPMTATLAEAEALAPIVAASRQPFALTYTYTGYAMIREARARVAAGAIGRVRKITVDYPQGWLSDAIEGENMQAGWRTDPARAGAGGAIGDIGVHAFQLAEYVSGLQASELVADLPRVVPGRRLDDDCNILLRFAGDVPGVLTASQIATGERNGLRLRIYGDKGGLEWCHDAPGDLVLRWPDARSEIFHAGAPTLSPDAQRAIRLPSGHPEGFIEAFATLYSDFADAIHGISGRLDTVLPGIRDGLRSMRFVGCAVRSHDARAWLPFPGDPA
ncbi:Gfo/Idh/MocA family protein [Sphingomonas oryzagri]|uniref:Gfo/Idh/MocA family oxidoreductase n=1 Tax=Sphingomonas oryzagri TaxID=3042314 RepID=A0ABT6MZ66_9SPHN|nr:Gfo/Idh/MocA family oxidoreductase [Sphingomonas oryzagri]MDH7638349.1 Gfo/Idh/MocA family oxidoreductase [Sphingomonas oryzagri]